ncbi:MAG: transposase [Pseudolabrys sp.]|nr:transposase [Pseudolabrys sp.]
MKVLLPIDRKPERRGRRRPPDDNRNIINGILWCLRTGAPWRDVPEEYGNWNSIYRRFRRASACGVWKTVAVALAESMAEGEALMLLGIWRGASFADENQEKGFGERGRGAPRGDENSCFAAHA